MNINRKILIAIIAAVVIIIFVVIFLIVRQNINAAPGGATGSGGNDQEQVAPLSQVLPNAPTSTTLTIGTPAGTVTVNNFYLNSTQVTDGGATVILASTTDYLITYDTLQSSFWIGIAPDKFAALRTSVEQQLVSMLGVNQSDACKLNVSVATFYAATSTSNGKSAPLSFCGSGVLPQ